MKAKIFIGVLVLLAIIGTAQAGSGENATDTANVSVGVAQLTAINMDPNSLSWTSVNPGTECGGGGACNETNDYNWIEIENIGSSNLSLVWFNATYPTSRPFGTGIVLNYDAGNFVVLLNRTNSGTFHPINRHEFNESDTLYYLKDPNGNLPPAGFNYGRYRNTSNEYFWMINNTGGCNDTGKTLYMGETSHTKTVQGTTDFTGGDVSSLGIDGTDGSWGYGAVDDGPFNGEMCFAINATCDEIIFYRWNMDSPGATSCANAEYAWNQTTHGLLSPGQYFPMQIRVYVPYGVAEGTVKQGTLTVIGQSA